MKQIRIDDGWGEEEATLLGKFGRLQIYRVIAKVEMFCLSPIQMTYFSLFLII